MILWLGSTRPIVTRKPARSARSWTVPGDDHIGPVRRNAAHDAAYHVGSDGGERDIDMRATAAERVFDSGRHLEVELGEDRASIFEARDRPIGALGWAPRLHLLLADAIDLGRFGHEY